jgi:hypothetical protein
VITACRRGISKITANSAMEVMSGTFSQAAGVRSWRFSAQSHKRRPNQRFWPVFVALCGERSEAERARLRWRFGSRLWRCGQGTSSANPLAFGTIRSTNSSANRLT